MAFLGRHQGYLSPRVGSPVLKHVASGDRAIGICNTGRNVEENSQYDLLTTP